jgi:predicted DsbA family dithiol-disulfide isomerase
LGFNRQVRVDIWSDLVCPWCYIGKRRYERALETFAHRDGVETVHRAFQLDPSAPAGETRSRRDMLMKKYGWSDDQLTQIDDRMTRTAAAEGLVYRLDGGVTGTTFDAHRIVHLGAAHGIQDAVVERLFRAHFTEQRSLFEHGSLASLAAEAGLDRGEVERVLQGRDQAAGVADDIAQARALGVTGVPFFVFGGRYSVSGAQSAEAFAGALARAWGDTHAASAQA